MNKDYETIDVHHMYVDEAMRVIIDKINYCYENNITRLEVIHGFNKGNRIKTRVLHLSSNDHPSIVGVREKLNNNGISVVTLKMHEM